MPPLFDKNQQLDESEIVDSLSNKAPRSHTAMLILQGFNPETGNMENFAEHYERACTRDNTTMANFYASDKESDTRRHKKLSKKFKEREDNGNKHHKKNSSLYCSLHG